MPTSQNVNILTQLTNLIALHGVYALTAIFLFYMEWRARKNIRQASSEHRTYFRKIYGRVVALAFVLVLISTGVWIYATFFFRHPTMYIEGSITDLKEQEAEPRNPAEKPKKVHLLDVEGSGSDIAAYTRKISRHPEGSADIFWVVASKSPRSTLVFTFQQIAALFQKRERKWEPDPAQDASPLERKVLHGKFILDLGKIGYSSQDSIRLVYIEAKDDSYRSLGTVYARTANQDLVPLAWEGSGSPPSPRATLINSIKSFAAAWLHEAFAASAAPFAANGDYDPQFARLLRLQLGSLDLSTQLVARRLVADNGARALKFINDSLQQTEDAPYDRAVMIQNLAMAVEDIQSRGTAVPPEIFINFAVAFYNQHDYKSAAKNFDLAKSAPLRKIVWYYHRGLSYARMRRYQDAIRSYEEYLNRVEAPVYKAVAHVRIGTAYRNLDQDEQAIQNFKKAMELYPQYPGSYNGLAYLYATRGKNLEEALALVNKALKLDPNEPDYLDTKGWILFKLDKPKEALPYVQQAAKQLPKDQEILSHLEEVKKALTPSKKP